MLKKMCFNSLQYTCSKKKSHHSDQSIRYCFLTLISIAHLHISMAITVVDFRYIVWLYIMYNTKITKVKEK